MSDSIFEREKKSIFQTYGRLPISVEKSKGLRVYSSDGDEYLDFLGGIAVNILGHSHPKILETIRVQSERYLHISNYFYQDAQINLADELKNISGFDRVFFSNSGSESNEGAIKLARKWGSENNKSDIIAFTGGFHGRTYGALSMMDKPLYMDGMGPYLPNRYVIEYNSIEALNQYINENTNAVVLECIQGEGGLAKVSQEFVDELKRLKEKFNFLIIADEVQSGVGRTGKFSAFEHFDLNPDIATYAKGIGGGLPLGAIMAKEEVAKVWIKGNHGTTFGGNALSCAVGVTVMNELNNGLMEYINSISEYLNQKLQFIQETFPEKVKEVRGMGLMTGLKLNFEAAKLVNELFERKVIANSASGTVLRLLPPYVLTKDDIDEFIEKLQLTLQTI